ncbi:MAG: GTP-binding protein [Ectothiorhodospiraceae bacterium]|nr:GTP-binding protein [Ectothiorhodospiraceae bacterium]
MYGDRQQEPVLIGINMDAPALRARFDACLLTDEAFAKGQATWRSLPDPFPGWSAADAAETTTT